MAGVLPTHLLKFDDGTGTYPINMTSRLDLESISIAPYGRADEATTATTTTLNITLQNNDGALSSGASQISAGQGVRYTRTVGATTVDQFTGRVSAADLSWEGGPAKKANLVVTALDVTAELGRRQMRSMLEEQVLVASPFAYYPLSEAEGSTAAGDISGNFYPTLVPSGSGVAPTFGTSTGPADGEPAPTFNGGQGLATVSTGAPFVTAGHSWSMAAVFSSTTPASGGLADGIVQLFGATAQSVDMRMTVGALGLGSGGSLQISTPGTFTDGALHSVIATFNGTTTLRLYVDGAFIGSSGLGAAVTGAGLTTLTLGGDATGTGALQPWTGMIDHVAVYDGVVLSAGQASDIAAITLGTLSETTDARLSRLASYAGLTATTTTPSGQLMATQGTSGSSLLDALEGVALAEGGLLYVDGSGNIQMQGRYYRGQQTTAALALTGRDLDPASTSITLDVQQTINQVIATRTGGAQQVALDQTSIDSSGIWPQSVDLAVASDGDALGYAQWTVLKHATVGPRMAQVTFNMFTSANREAILGAKVGDRVSFASMPSQLFSGFGDCTLEGWSDSFSVSGGNVTWTRTANLLPWSLFQVALWDDAGSKWDTAVWGY